jgi:hypothetical protein
VEHVQPTLPEQVRTSLIFYGVHSVHSLAFCSVVFCRSLFVVLSFILVIVLSVLHFGHCIVCPSFWSLYCLSLILVIVLSVLHFCHCIVCPSFWSLYCLSLFILRLLFTYSLSCSCIW